MIHRISRPEVAVTSQGKRHKLRSYSRATIFAITTLVRPRPSSKWYKKYPALINVKLHSSHTWRSTIPDKTEASTELTLTRSDALFIAASLLQAVTEIDKADAGGV